MLFKVLNEDGTIYRHNGDFQWSLPTKNEDGTWTPGEWMPAITGELIACKNGYHLCTLKQLIGWLGPAIFVAEHRGEYLDAGDTTIVREARLTRKVKAWNERTARLFACDCAEHVLPLFENEFPTDERPRQVIEVSRWYANGMASCGELTAAAWAACAAAWDVWAACAAARAAVRATWYAAWGAIEVVVRDAAKAAGDAEQKWQIGRLQHYLGLS